MMSRMRREKTPIITPMVIFMNLAFYQLFPTDHLLKAKNVLASILRPSRERKMRKKKKNL